MILQLFRARAYHLAKRHRLRLVLLPELRDFGMAVADRGVVLGPPISGLVAYAIVLHEIAHCVLGHRPVRSATAAYRREISAWEWAQSKAGVWTPAMERRKRSALRSYKK